MIGDSMADSIEPLFTNKVVDEGDDVTLSCNYKPTISTNNYLHWYRQHPKSNSKFLLYISKRGDLSPDKPPRMSAKVDDGDKKQVDLIISSAAVSDSALYYCALVPTVTGNPAALYKNIHTVLLYGKQELITIADNSRCMDDYDQLPVAKRQTNSALTHIVMKCFDKTGSESLHCGPTTYTRPTPVCLSALHSALTHLDENNTYIKMLFIEFRSAFNTVLLTVLITKLRDLGICTSTCRWILDFLANRPQFVRLDKRVSLTLILNTGIPQGCSEHTSLLPVHPRLCSSANIFIKYADDTTVVSQISNNGKISETRQCGHVSILVKIFDIVNHSQLWQKSPTYKVRICLSLELEAMFRIDYKLLLDVTVVVGLISNNEETAYLQELKNLEKWCQENNLLLNVSKIKELIMDSTKQGRSYQLLNINGTPVERVDSFRYLGVHIKQDLSWSCHTNTLVKKARHRLYHLRRLRDFKLPSQNNLNDPNQSGLKAAHYTEIALLAVSEKLHAAWSSLNAIRPLQIIQNAAARLLFNLPKFSHTTPLLRSLHWLPVAARIRFKTLMLASKAKNGPAPSYLNDHHISHCTTLSEILQHCSTGTTFSQNERTMQDRRALQRVVRSAERTIHTKRPNLQDIYSTWCRTRARKIVKDLSHPNNGLFSLLRSGKRFRSLKANTERMRRSFFPEAIQSLNQETPRI
ncbi:gastrula zinc finger protein XlCGF28.1-like [Silurus meridionalis]|nr:gastrula zinc finger protein XlCGF28.1-like [Silurus meridionalis]